MSLFSKIQSAAKSAQTTLAQLQGAPRGTANTLLGTNQKVLGVYGNPVVLFIPLNGGGYRKKTVTTLTITRGQMDAPPAPNANLMRTDMTPQIKYTIESVDTQDVLVWRLNLVNFAA